MKKDGKLLKAAALFVALAALLVVGLFIPAAVQQSQAEEVTLEILSFSPRENPITAGESVQFDYAVHHTTNLKISTEIWVEGRRYVPAYEPISFPNPGVYYPELRVTLGTYQASATCRLEVVGCGHSGGRYKEYHEPIYDPYSASQHKKVVPSDEYCSNCNKYLGSGEEIRYENHSWVGDVCSLCDETRECQHTGGTYRELDDVDYEQYSADRHKEIRSYTIFCSACGEPIDGEEEINYRDHSWVRDVCSFCDETRECQHTGGTYRELDNVDYEKFSAEKHKEIKDYAVLCSTCGERLRTEQETGYVSHSWDGDECPECGERRQVEQPEVPEEVDNTKPQVEITRPGNKDRFVKGDVINISGNGHDDKEMNGVQLYLDGKPVGNKAKEGSVSYRWNTSTAALGSHTIKISGMDKAGNITSRVISISIVPEKIEAPITPESSYTTLGNAVVYNNKFKQTAEELAKQGRLYVTDGSGRIYKKKLLSNGKTDDQYICRDEIFEGINKGVFISGDPKYPEDKLKLYHNTSEGDQLFSIIPEKLNWADEKIEEQQVIWYGAQNAFEAGSIDWATKAEIQEQAHKVADAYREVRKGKFNDLYRNLQKKTYIAQKGSKGQKVWDIQNKLHKLGCTSQMTDSDYGPVTFNNVAYIQIISKTIIPDLEVTGYVDKLTYELVTGAVKASESKKEAPAPEPQTPSDYQSIDEGDPSAIALDWYRRVELYKAAGIDEDEKILLVMASKAQRMEQLERERDTLKASDFGYSTRVLLKNIEIGVSNFSHDGLDTLIAWSQDPKREAQEAIEDINTLLLLITPDAMCSSDEIRKKQQMIEELGDTWNEFQNMSNAEKRDVIQQVTAQIGAGVVIGGGVTKGVTGIAKDVKSCIKNVVEKRKVIAERLADERGSIGLPPKGAAKGVGRLTVVKDSAGNVVGWKSKAGLFYKNSDPSPLFDNKVEHILPHTDPSSGKSVFKGSKSDAFDLIDNAWSKADSSKYYTNKGNWVYEINMNDVVGTNNETFIRIVVEPGTSNVVSSYPIFERSAKIISNK